MKTQHSIENLKRGVTQYWQDCGTETVPKIEFDTEISAHTSSHRVGSGKLLMQLFLFYVEQSLLLFIGRIDFIIILLSILFLERRCNVVFSYEINQTHCSKHIIYFLRI